MKPIFLALTAALSVCASVTGTTASARPTATPAIAVQATSKPSLQDQRLASQLRLDRAREAYQNGVSELARSLNLDMRAIEAHRRDLGTISPDFSDEEVRLRQRFADGDRVGTWPTIRQLSLSWRARANPGQRLLGAARARSDAVLLSIMVSARDTGASNGELVALWDEAAALDPLSFEAHMGRSRAALALGDAARARLGADMALSAARTPADIREATTARELASRAL